MNENKSIHLFEETLLFYYVPKRRMKEMLEQVKELCEVVATWIKENPKTTAIVVATPVAIYTGKKVSEEVLARAFEDELKKQVKAANKAKQKKNKKKKAKEEKEVE